MDKWSFTTATCLGDERATATAGPDKVCYVNFCINGGILKEGALIRQHDSPTYPYTKVAELEPAMLQFYEELFKRLRDPRQDLVELAAWIEYRIDLTDHFFADGCGKTSKAVSAWVLMRNNRRLLQYPVSRGALFSHAPTQVRGQDAAVDDAQFAQWRSFYRDLFKDHPAAAPVGESNKASQQAELTPEEKYKALPPSGKAAVEQTRHDIERQHPGRSEGGQTSEDTP